MYKRSLIIVVCVLLIVGLLFAPFSTPARAIVGVDDALAGGLFLGFLAALGLDFSFMGVDMNKESLLEIIQDAYNNFRASQNMPLIAIATAWAALDQAVFSGGSIKIPEAAASDMYDFTEYLIDEYDLSTGDSAVVDYYDGYFLNDGSIVATNIPYEPDRYYTLMSGNSFGMFTSQVSGRERYYQFRFIIDGDIVNGSSGTISSSLPELQYCFYGWNNNHPLDGRLVVIGQYADDHWTNTGGYYWSGSASNITVASLAGETLERTTYLNRGPTSFLPPSGVIEDVYIRIPGVTDVFGGSIAGAADQITSMALDEDLTATYEMTDTAPVYPDPAGPTATNIYGIVFPSAPFGSIWHYVVELVAEVSGYVLAVRSVWAILPEAMMLPLYAGIVLALVIGGFKVFRGVH